MVERLRDNTALAEEREGEVEKLKREKSFVNFSSRDNFSKIKLIFLYLRDFILHSGLTWLVI